MQYHNSNEGKISNCVFIIIIKRKLNSGDLVERRTKSGVFVPEIESLKTTTVGLFKHVRIERYR